AGAGRGQDRLVQLVHLTDIHFGCEDKAALQAAARYVAETGPDAVVITGDITIAGRAAEHANACAWMRELAAPVILTPGNHDVPYYNMWGRLAFPWRRYESAAAELMREAWHTPQWSIVPVNTA